ncbi:MAG: hypothetical protein JSS78_05575 [Bacteroidetes bacterium]|nr:hypothetical protein [Bacteroidota bacterium]
MAIVLVVATILLAIVLYKLLGKNEKTYAYTHTMTITYRIDGTEQIQKMNENGIVFITGKKVLIDGNPYVYQSSDRRKIQARLNREGKRVKTIVLFLTNGGEKYYYVDQINNIKDVVRRP